MMSILVGILFTVPVAYANTAKPTLENAHAFIKEMIEQKRLTGYHLWRWSNDITDFKSQNCETSYTVKHSHSLFNESKVNTIDISKITIHWGQVSEVSKGKLSHISQERIGLDRGIWINGNIQENGNTDSSTILKVTDSDATRDRLVKAMDFIRQHCDATNKYGF